MTKKKEKYCYLTPNFPKEAFMVAVFFTSTITPLMITPLSAISENIDDVIERINEFVKELKITDNKNAKEIMEVIDRGVLIPITFQKLFPLKKEHWTKAVKDPNLLDRIFAFLPAMNKPQFYKLLVVPYGHVKKHWEFSIAYPFSIFSEDSEIEKFIYGSEQVVDIGAKYAAIYSFGVPKRLNWKTGEVSEIDKTKPEENKTAN